MAGILSRDCARPSRVFFAAMGLLLASCVEGPLLPPNDDQLALGEWGGDNAGVIVSDNATHVHIGCTFGDMPGIIPLDANGRFTIDGSYVLRAFPIQIGPSLPAQFSGRVVGARLTLVIAVNDTTEDKVVALGPVTVQFGRQPEMGPCPICRIPGARGQGTGEALNMSLRAALAAKQSQRSPRPLGASR